MKRILVCGSRDWTDKEFIYKRLDGFLQLFKEVTILEGACRGADSIAGEWARERGVPLEEYPAEWDKFGPSAGPLRNKRMLEEGRPSLVLAFTENIATSKGTRDMTERAIARSVQTLIISYNGVAVHGPVDE